jgi:hypothetical protein
MGQQRLSEPKGKRQVKAPKRTTTRARKAPEAGRLNLKAPQDPAEQDEADARDGATVVAAAHRAANIRGG